MRTRTFVLCMFLLGLLVYSDTRPPEYAEFGPKIPHQVVFWKTVLSQYPEGTAIILTDSAGEVDLGVEYGIPINLNVDFLWFSDGGIYSYSYPDSYYEEEWIAPKPTSVITYLDQNGNVLGTYQAKNAENLPVDIEIRVKPYRLPICHYKSGAFAELIETSHLYVIEVYDDGGGWSAGCNE